jgi:hypothetical protein
VQDFICFPARIYFLNISITFAAIYELECYSEFQFIYFNFNNKKNVGQNARLRNVVKCREGKAGGREWKGGFADAKVMNLAH